MNVACLKELEEIFIFKTDVQSTGSPEWFRVFITRKDGIQIGRVNFKNGKLYNIKNYKKDYINSLDETDCIFMRMQKYFLDKTIISLEMYNKLIEKAKQVQKEDLEQKLKWRKENNPNKKRKKIEGKNIRRILQNLILNY